jgi:hypothetical protein
MKSVKTISSNHVFGPPHGQEDKIGSLDCQIEENVGAFGGGRVIWSVWELSDEDRKAISNGYNIRLGVGWIGAFPPVSVGVTHEKGIQHD